MKKKAWLLLFPGLLMTLLFVVFPMFQVLYPTLVHGGNFGHLYVQFLQDAYNREIVFRTIWLAVITTIIVLLISIPLAFWISRQQHKMRSISLLLVLFPMLTNGVVLNFTWLVILGRNGIFNRILLFFHIISQPLDILYNNYAIVIGSVYTFIPIMVLSLLGGFSSLNPDLEKAAAVLGAKRHTIFNKIILPAMIPSIITGIIWTFSWMMTSYTTPAVLGGNKDLVLSTLIYQEAMSNQNWVQAGVIAYILVAISLVCLGLIKLVIGSLDRGDKRV